MNLVLSWYWKEWRAQRGLLTAYLGLVFGCIALGLWLMPRHYWLAEEFGVHAVSWFVLAGVIGVVAFATPGLVRGEFTAPGKDDQFIRRLPGALWPAWLGKGLFLLVMTLLLPLLGLSFGLLYVALIGESWDGFYSWQWTGDVDINWPWQSVVCAGGLLTVPWVWAAGTWLPGGRLALGGAASFVLLVGVLVFAVMRQSPGLDEVVDPFVWLWWLTPTGLIVAAVSFACGRRGGGPLRSLRVGLMASAGALAPCGVLLGAAAWDYHHPDPGKLASIHVRALSPDGRFALARGSAHPGYMPAPFRIDLETGAATQLAGVWTSFVPAPTRPFSMWDSGVRSAFREVRADGDHFRDVATFDLATGQRWAAPSYDEATKRWLLPPELREKAMADSRRLLGIRGPDKQDVWFEDGQLVVSAVDGTRTRRAWPLTGGVLPAGHGFRQWGSDEQRLFRWNGDPVSAAAFDRGWLIGSQLVFQVQNSRQRGEALVWRQRDLTGNETRVGALDGCLVFGLLDDERLLCARRSATGRWSLRWYRPDTGEKGTFAFSIESPGGSLGVMSPFAVGSSLLPRDPGGRIWLRCSGDVHRIVIIDEKRGVMPNVMPAIWQGGRRMSLLAWLDENRALVTIGAQILEIEVATGKRRVLFPPADR